MIERLIIEELGAQGDGVVHTSAGPVYVPFALPGETLTARVEKQRGTLETIEQPSPLRVEPACRHFGVCGGCAVQHLEAGAYAEWKREKVLHALRSHGLQAQVAPLMLSPPGSRRRLTFSARVTEAGVLLGFNEALSHRIIDIKECPIAVPEIISAADDLRALVRLLASGSKPIRMAVTATRTGPDIAADLGSKLDEKRRRQAVEFALAKRFARLSLGREVIVEREKPTVLFGEVPVAIPPGGFLQATREAEEAMATLVMEHLQGSKHITDLFAGSGTFALRLARSSRVHAVEGDLAALGALETAAKHTPGLKPVTVEKRDLFHRPLLAKELNQFDGLVFDPPRAGAEAQCRQIARSTVRRVAAVSCNPGTLARDLAILVEGGYRIASVTPIDQFLWSPHVEVVALLERAGKRG